MTVCKRATLGHAKYYPNGQNFELACGVQNLDVAFTKNINVCATLR